MGRRAWPQVHGASDDARSAAADIRLYANHDCEHWLCWQVHCRHCELLLDPHVGAEELTETLAVLRPGHRCPRPAGRPTRSGPQDHESRVDD